VDPIPPSAAFIRRQEPSAFSAPDRSRNSAPAQLAPGRPRARARENRPAATRRTSSSSSTSSADPGDPEPPAGPGWRWASDASWRNFVKSITSRDFEHEVALERLTAVAAMTARLHLAERALDYAELDPLPHGRAETIAAKCPTCRDRTGADGYPLTVAVTRTGALRVECLNGCPEGPIRDAIPGFDEGGGGHGGLGDQRTRTTRYEGRHIDLGPLLSAPAKPIPWRVDDLVADGTVTVLSGESGSGKSWLAQALCTGVRRGTSVAGLPCTPGKALYVDAEMGPQMFVDQRLRPAGITTPEFEYIDAMGLDVSKPSDLGWLKSKIVGLGVNLVVIDSLRRLAPSKAENDSDDMAPTIAAIAKLARDTGAALLLIHHKGDGQKFYRGSTAIRDQTDALFALLREGQPDDDERQDDGVRRLRCRGGRGKMRYAPEPSDV
jgi:hypothetical protein